MDKMTVRPRVFNRSDIRLVEIEPEDIRLAISEDPTFFVWDTLSAGIELDKIDKSSARLSTPSEEIYANDILLTPYSEDSVVFREYPDADSVRSVREFRKTNGILTDVVIVENGICQKQIRHKSPTLDWPPDLTIVYDLPNGFVKNGKIKRNLALRGVRYEKESGNILIVSPRQIFDIPNLFWKTATYYNPEDLDFETGMPKKLSLTKGEFVFGSKFLGGNYGVKSGYVVIHHDGSITSKGFYSSNRNPVPTLYPYGEPIERYHTDGDFGCRAVFDIGDDKEQSLRKASLIAGRYNAELRQYYKRLGEESNRKHS